MSSFTGVSSIRNVQWKFQKNLQESILLILKTQYIFEFSGLFHCSVIKVLCCCFCVSDKYYIKSLLLCQDFFKTFLFCCFVFTASARYILSDGNTFVNTFFHFFWFFFSICSNPRKFDIFRDFRAVLTDSPIVIRLPSIAKGYPAGGFQPDIPSLHWVLL